MHRDVPTGDEARSAIVEAVAHTVAPGAALPAGSSGPARPAIRRRPRGAARHTAASAAGRDATPAARPGRRTAAARANLPALARAVPPRTRAGLRNATTRAPRSTRPRQRIAGARSLPHRPVLTGPAAPRHFGPRAARTTPPAPTGAPAGRRFAPRRSPLPAHRPAAYAHGATIHHPAAVAPRAPRSAAPARAPRARQEAPHGAPRPHVRSRRSHRAPAR